MVADQTSCGWTRGGSIFGSVPLGPPYAVETWSFSSKIRSSVTLYFLTTSESDRSRDRASAEAVVVASATGGR
jgi:hypothetical protein